jgi:hypothetical protein
MTPISPLERTKSTKIRGRSKKIALHFLLHKYGPNFQGRPIQRNEYCLACYELLRSLFIPNIRTKSEVLTAVYSFSKETSGQIWDASPFIRSDYIRCGETQSH